MNNNCKILLVLLLSGFCSGATMPARPTVLPADKQSTIKGNNQFAFDLYAKLTQKEKDNLFFSPYSISTALAMTYAGARGETAAQMAKVLHFDLQADRLHPAYGAIIKDLNAKGKKEAYQLSVANALWAQKDYPFLPSYIDLVKQHYKGGLEEVDFARNTEATRKAINDWVEKQTQDKIKELIKPGLLDELTRLVLTNAIYFKGNWAAPFNKDQTKDEPFYLTSGKNVKVPMMNQTSEFMYAQINNLQILELPYAGDDLSMVVLLPAKNTQINQFEKQLRMQNLNKWLKELRKRNVKVTMPKFKMTFDTELSKELKSMGMPDAFSGKSDFSGMDGTRFLFISAVIHQAFVDVNEEGTEAAAATAVIMDSRSAAVPSPIPVFRADRPFVFLIRDQRSNNILFLGRVMNPKTI